MSRKNVQNCVKDLHSTKHIYIYRERERVGKIWELPNIYIYIYIYIIYILYIDIYKYIYTASIQSL